MKLMRREFIQGSAMTIGLLMVGGLGAATKKSAAPKTSKRAAPITSAMVIRDALRDAGHVETSPDRAEVHVGAFTVDVDDVLHAPSGTSSHTVSTCAVCGNMSKQTSYTIR